MTKKPNECIYVTAIEECIRTLHERLYSVSSEASALTCIKKRLALAVEGVLLRSSVSPLLIRLLQSHFGVIIVVNNVVDLLHLFTHMFSGQLVDSYRGYKMYKMFVLLNYMNYGGSEEGAIYLYIIGYIYVIFLSE